MKKGKRQIVEKNPFGEDSGTTRQQISQGQTSFQSNFTSQPISKPTCSQEDCLVTRTFSKPRGQGSPFSHQNQVSYLSKRESAQIASTRANEVINPIGISKTKKADISVFTAVEEKAQVRQPPKAEKETADEKKNRIQMLKQKYLKKGAQAKPTAQIQEPVAVKSNIPLKREEIIVKGNEAKAQLPKQTLSAFNPQPQPKKVNIQTPVRPQIDQKQQKVYLPQRSEQSKSKAIIQIHQQDGTQKDQSENKIHISTKKQQRKSRVPPPPSHNYAKNQTSGYPKQQKATFPPKEQNIQNSQTIQINEQPEAEQKQVVVPLKQTKIKVPPPAQTNQSPSKSNTIQQILARKLKKKVTASQQHSNNLEIEQQHAPQKQQLAQKPQSIQMPIDQQYETDQKRKFGEHQQPQVLLPQTTTQFHFIDGVKAWCNENEEPFSNIFSAESRLVSILYRKKEVKQINFVSKNASFSPIISKIINQFILKSKGELTQGQKAVLNQLALEFFYSDLKLLTTSFLIILVKLGKYYMRKYKQFFKTNLESYCLDLIQYKEYFVDEELINFVQFLLEETDISQKQYYLLILLKITENIAAKFTTNQINDQKALLLMILACQHIYRTNRNILGLYLQLASYLINQISDQLALLQSILKYFNKFENHQKYYQLQKQMKLKLINLISKGQNPATQKHQQARTNQKKGQNLGLMSFWNKAVDKLKNATTQLTQKEKAEPEEPEEDIKYDPVSKRYLVNGKAFQDEQSAQKNENASKLPPTPPPPRPTKSVAPPPPPGNKKPRTITAVNRYA